MRWTLSKIVVVIAVCLTHGGDAAAFSDPLSYADPVDLGGGAGRWFTGSPADGYGCDVCHRGNSGADLSVTGLPTDRLIPGQGYEVTVTWPVQVENAALIAEFTDEARHGFGVLALPRPETLGPGELCTADQGGAPPAQLHDTEDGRQLVSIVDCGARLLRFQWTPPPMAASTIWFNLGFVNSDQDATPNGDGVTLVRLPLTAAGGTTQTVVAQGCSATAAPPGSSRMPLALLLAVPVGLRVRRRVRSRS